MKASKIGLLLLILAFGSTVETAWRVRNHLGLGHWNWLAWGDRFHGPSFTFAAEEAQTVGADAPVEVENAFGGVTVVQGAPGEVKIGLRKVVFLPSEEKAREYGDRIVLRTRREGGALRIGTNRLELERERLDGRQVGFETHLDLTVPPGTPVTVANDHGEVQVSDVARLDVNTSHGAVRVERVGGPAVVRGRHGEVRVGGVKGALELTNRHGHVSVTDVEGPVTVEAEHGGVEVARVGALVLRGAHGDVRVETVAGDLEVTTRHGAVHATDVTGRATVGTSFDHVTLDRVGGDVRVRSEHGRVSVTDARAAVDVQSSFDHVALVRVAGPVTVEVRHGGVQARGIEKGARIKASSDEVVLEAFKGPVEVEVERAGARLVPAGPITDAVKASTHRGGIEFEVPPGSRFDLQASAEHGSITTDIADLAATEAGSSRVAGKVGGGGSMVVLSARNGDVRLRRGSLLAQQAP